MTIQDLDAIIASSRPKRRTLRSSSFILLGLSMLLGALLADPGFISEHPIGWLLPQAVLIAMICFVVRNVARQRQMARGMVAAIEAVQLKQWPQAHEALRRLLRYPIQHRVARAEALLALAAVAESDHNYEVAQKLYETLLKDNDADPIQLHSARVALAAAMMRTGQVTDAVKMIERLERADLPDPLRAQVELLGLFREVTMGQLQSAVERADQRRQLFRQYLGTRAAYGYGLLAAAFDRINRPNQAAAYWHDATLLLRPSELTERFKELEDVAAKYSAVEFAL